MDVGEASSFLVVINLASMLAVYFFLGPIIARANEHHSRVISEANKDAASREQYIVYEVEGNPYSLKGFLALLSIFGFGIVLTFAFLRTADDVGFDGILELALIIFVIWLVSALLYAIHMNDGTKLMVVSSDGIELRSVDLKGCVRSQKILWHDVFSIGVGETEQGGDRFGIFINGRKSSTLYGDWVNAKLFCEDALRHVPRKSFTSDALDHFSMYSAKQSGIKKL